MAICQKSWEPSFWEVMNSFFISICKFGSFKNPFEMITSLSKLYFKFIRFILLVQIKKVISMNYCSSTSSWKPRRWVRLYLILSMRDIYINFNLSPFTKFTSSCRSTKFKGILPWNISRMITKTVPISTRIVISNAMKWGIQGLIQKEKVDICAPQSVRQCREHPVSTPEKMIRISQWSETQVGKLTIWVMSFEIEKL